ncbi:flavin containing amine oxidoreductase family protein [Acinetobacter sp. 1130196]|uniref:NAD(P)/FAD-dependent oxidoreductase n=1 Tax=Acinetobacter calcoaceticus/baumannii complex TaxID=909768 RepID=UPI00044C45AF|nr:MULTISPECIES: NAD(P)-binding protein [Acinetobacter calcoaceticus/baumannii complex]EKU6036399.1 FAD-dependent oxidoreductase [Acinetobacter nosocomialis]EXE75703.1 flavin containing amine oxidoreductase family protein [Acinetobacter sp. 1566109]EXR11572.1 flavin containing amine oxidoreductase family protein [Acinetobacter sp. 1130196]MBJ9962385.1 FAD-dependent oxidoreductase [Acinetobacter nosocomialis]OTL13866.1 dehydrogenase [Acinetobacter nosocomialis]
MKIAIIGSGISGLYAAWKLSKQHQVTIYEKNNYFGGHTDTHELDIDGTKIAVDSGFIVFNDYNYPLFTDMLKNLGVETQYSDMSFSVNNLVSGLQYNPSKKWSLFARPQNFLNRKFLQMLSDLLRFYDDNKDIDVADIDPNLSIEDYLDQHKYSAEFRYEHLYPMCGALWSAPVEQVGQIPYRFVVSFFQHHRMLQLKERPQWQTVKHGSASYIRAIQKSCPSLEWKFAEVKGVSRSPETVWIETSEGQAQYDWVIFASHADDSLGLIKDASSLEQEILSQFDYQDNHMVVHRDLSIMPKSRLQWASWHVHVTPTSQVQNNESAIHYGFTYWMNNLQNLPCKTQIFCTLNPNMQIKAEDILVERHYRHPVFDANEIQAQSRWQEISGRNRTSFCGAYWGWGFHEDGARSAARVVEQLLAL